jgi:hypothetical protein
MTFIQRFIIAGILPAFVACGASPADAEDGEAAAVGVATEELAGNALTPAQAKQALKLVDDICGDTWCEGDNDFAFERLSCSALTHRCTLVFDVIPRDDGAAGRPFYRRSCTTRHFTGFASLVATAQNGYQSLQPDYYDALTECISRVEEKLP